MRIWVIASAVLIAATTPAYAGIELLFAAVYSTLLASPLASGLAASIGIVTASQILTGALVVGGLVASSLLFRQNVPNLNPGRAKQTFEESEGPEIRAVGRVRLGGLKPFGNTQDFDRYRVICHCKGPIDATEEYYLGSREVVIADDGRVQTTPYLKQFGTVPGNSDAIIKEKIGDGTETAWSELTTDFPSLWTAAHRLRGIAQSLVQYISPGFSEPRFLKLWQNGPPELNKVIRAELVYDPRTQATAWSDNGILCALHVLLTFPQLALADFDEDFTGDEADKADVLVAVRGEQISNGGFGSDTVWTKGAGWSIAGGVATRTDEGSPSTLEQTFAVVPGETYEVTFDVTAYTSGNIRPELRGGGSTALGSDVSAIGTYTQQLTAVSGNTTFAMRADADFSGAVDNVKLKRTEKRSRCWGIWSSEMPRGELAQHVLRSVGAEVVPRPNNKYGIRLIDDTRPAEVTIPLRHIVDLQFKSGPEQVERPNLARLKYYAPEVNYEMTEVKLTGISWARVQDEIDALGEQPTDIELPFCPSASQAQRIGRRLFAVERSDSGKALTNMYGLSVWGTRAVAFEFPDEIGTLTTAIAPPRVLDDRGQVEIPFVVWPTLSAWDPDVDEAAAPTPLPDEMSANDDVDPPAGDPTDAVVVTYPDMGVETRLGFAMTSIGFPFEIEAIYRTMPTTIDKPSAWRTMTPGLVGGVSPAETDHAYLPAVDLDGILSDFRIRRYNRSNGEVSTWMATLRIAPVVDNSAPADPGFVGADDGQGQFTLTATAPSDLNVAYLSFTGPNAPADTAVRPNEVVSFVGDNSAPFEGTWTCTAHASDGTASGTVTVLGPG